MLMALPGWGLGLTAAIVASGPSDAFADECPAVVAVRGPAEARHELEAALARIGLTVDAGAPARPACPRVLVRLQPVGRALAVDITDLYGRTTTRTVSRIDAVADLIESRTAVEILSPLLGEHSRTDGEVASAPVAPGSESSAVAASPAPVSAPRERPRSSGPTFAVATEAALASDRSTWFGVNLAGCLRLGRTCVGTVVRIKRDVSAGPEPAATLRRRGAADILVSVERPLALGAVVVRPGLGVGFGWMHMGGFRTAMVTDDERFDRGGLRTAADVNASWPLLSQLSVEAGIGVATSPFAHTAPFMEAGVSVPGEPRKFVHGTLGLRFGGP